MNTKKWPKMIIKGLEYFSTSAGAVTLVFSLVGIFVSIPLTVVFPIAGAIGLVFGVWGMRQAYRQHVKHKLEKQKRAEERAATDKVHLELVQLTHELGADLKEHYHHDHDEPQFIAHLIKSYADDKSSEQTSARFFAPGPIHGEAVVKEEEPKETKRAVLS